MKPFGFDPAARRELIDASLRYAAISAALGRRFVEHVDGIIGEIRADPTRHRMFDPPVRRHFKRPFPYAVVFLEKPDRIWIVAVMHFKQQPGYWRGRLG